MSVFGIDYSWGRPGTAALKKAGAKFVCRYLSDDPSGKNLTRAEADELSAAGIWVVVVWESAKDRALAGRSGGTADAKAAAAQATACGMPGDRPIYFAVDFDATAAQQSKINAYLDGAASVIGQRRVGVYGGYGPVKRSLDAGKAAWAWQTYAWSGGKWDSRAHIQQYLNEQVLNGAAVDHDRAMKDDYGQWRVGVTPARDPAPGYVSVGVTTARPLPPGRWTNVSWDKDYADGAHQHADEGGPSILWGPAKYALTASVTIRGLAAGTAVRARAIEVVASDVSEFDAGPVQSFTAAAEDAHVLYALPADGIGKDRRLRFQVMQLGPAEASIVAGAAKLLYWRG
ncbi:glycoside hydrolase domain-containing protein [Actinomadura sp. HBU206391]|uniref:glycoside hydrolase domain-containing protein n=1 Tax=Actinomadura sp. HBU206391 TaxID=2731692 RepID=UPI00164F798E|nr:glycoside hydrolase domain-containing protein [Actinomadura sp. HBU206391]MBC6458818.1 DUF1906 domain-containing protein [Actinomadura sp. HBU206391]